MQRNINGRKIIRFNGFRSRLAPIKSVAAAYLSPVNEKNYEKIQCPILRTVSYPKSIEKGLFALIKGIKPPYSGHDKIIVYFYTVYAN